MLIKIQPVKVKEGRDSLAVYTWALLRGSLINVFTKALVNVMLAGQLRDTINK